MADHHVRRSIGEHILRCFVLIVALFIMSLGIALSAKANLGVSPISCTPYVLSLALPLTMGTVTILMHLSFVAVQAALLKRQFRPAHLLQIPVVFIFGALTDFSMWLMAPLEPSGYLWSVILCLFSCAVIGFGVFLQVKADAVLLAAEGMSLAFVKLFKWEFGAVKTSVDCTLVCIGLACSFMFLPGLTGIREGTMVAAVLVGMIVRFSTGTSSGRTGCWNGWHAPEPQEKSFRWRKQPLTRRTPPWSSPLTGNTAPAAMPSAK